MFKWGVGGWRGSRLSVKDTATKASGNKGSDLFAVAGPTTDAANKDAPARVAKVFAFA